MKAKTKAIIKILDGIKCPDQFDPEVFIHVKGWLKLIWQSKLSASQSCIDYYPNILNYLLAEVRKIKEEKREEPKKKS